MKCDGTCDWLREGHTGIVKRVKVTGGGLDGTYKFNYCESAIETDRNNGYTVEILDE